MKPITLKMTAFGPYKTCEEIHFDTLHQYGLFAITGKTGAGKTTIFDAICFALYGSASGEDRNDQTMLRSDFADDTIPTRVELVFELRGKQYRIVRQPGHIKAGQKTVTGKEFLFVEMTADGEVPLTKRAIVSEIDAKIIELIGLSKAQFSQIVMLPQGEFRKLLTSDSKNKEAILQQLFTTERFDLVAQHVKERCQQLNKEREGFEVQLQQQVKTLKKNLPHSEAIQQLEALNIFRIERALQQEVQFLQALQQQAAQQYEDAVAEEQKINEQLQQQHQQNAELQAQQQRKEKYEQYEQQLTQIATLKQQLKMAQQAQQIKPFVTHKTRAEEAHKMAQQHVQMAMQKQAEQQQYQNELQAQEQKINTRKAAYEQIEKRLLQYQQWLPIMEKITAQQQLLQTQQQQLQAMIVQRDEAKKQYEHYTEALQQAQQQLAQLEEQEDHTNYELSLRDLEQQQKLINQQQQCRQQLKEVTEQIAQVTIVKQQMTAHVAQVKQRFLHYEAAQIANHLHDGDECPVCGHTVNIALMPLAQDVVSITEYEEAQAQYEAIHHKLTTLQVKQDQLNEQLAEYQQSIEVAEDIESDIAYVTQQLAQQETHKGLKKQQQQKITQCQTAWQAQQANYQNLMIKAQQLEGEKQTIEGQLTVYQQQVPSHVTLTSIQTELQQGEAQLQQWHQEVKAFNEQKERVEQASIRAEENVKHQQQVQDMTATQYDVAKQELQQMLQKHNLSITAYEQALTSEEDIKAWQTTITKFDEARSFLAKQIAEADQQLQGVTYAPIEPIEMALQNQQQVKSSCYEQLHHVKQAVNLCEQSLLDLQAVHKEMAHIETKYQAAKHLDDMLRGQGDNTKKLSFERYVQMYYFDQIIEAANLRLQHLANQQYRLLRSDKLARHNAQSGLTIDVYDVYTDQIRDVKTLSGGEKFNASLSLALGMADVIQQFKGNIQIDMMFIDEGFGSLDDASLTKAIDTLIELQQSGRTIGVISHVEELKNAMPAILQVQKNAEGSSTTQIIIK